ncbi:MAG: class I adenylate-forming enzyme family protein [Candidatus Hodarchaeales archaeon]|jgi:acyl-CoA synthetase (AMP-forming)/AMP-acid ligase II
MIDQAKEEECKRSLERLLPRMFDYVDHYAKEKSDDIAIIEYDTGEEVTWKDFATKSKAFSAKLLSMGLKKGDVLASSLPLLKEHIYLMYACYRTGIIIAPLDLRLKTHEIDRCFLKTKPKAYFFLGKTAIADFRPMIAEVMKKHNNTCNHWIQFQKEEDLIMEEAIGITEFTKGIKDIYIEALTTGKVKKAQKQVDKRDPCLIIFTTGSTGYPKPALLCHENILVQNIGLSVGFGMDENDIMCVNLPPSHVGCTTEQLATTIYGGGTSVILHVFDAAKTLDSVQKYKVTILGQIPALFAMQWRLPNYESYDLSSLRFALYGGQAVTRQFLEQLSTMAPQFGSGFGLTECGGFCTYSPLDGTVDDILASIGYHFPSLCPISIRDPMKEDGSAGDEKPTGEVGEICFTGPQTFLGYLDDEENTKKTISTDGICYTGDLGSYDDKGLHFGGRAKLVIKPKGYNVFPTEVEDFIEQKLKGKVETVACVGVPHEIFTEGMMAFVEKVKDADVTVEELNAVCSGEDGLAAYKRPGHFEILEPGEIPLNRVAKTDYMELKSRGKDIADRLRTEGGWDS